MPCFTRSIYDKLPTLLREFVAQYAELSTRRSDILLLSTLGAISSVLPQYSGLYEWKTVESNLFVMVVAPPASGKNIVSKARHAVNQVNRLIKNNNKEAIQKSKVEKDDKGGFTFKQTPKCLFLPGNSTDSGFLDLLDGNPDGMLIHEEEIDAINGMLA
jgi:hypothetical protein